MVTTFTLDEFVMQAGKGAGDALQGFGIWYLISLAISIVIIINIWRGHKALIPKVLWTLIVLFLSVIGWILYFFLGRERG